jgi:CRP-like cAMP-binding protein
VLFCTDVKKRSEEMEELLLKIPFFKDFTKEELTQLSSCCEEKKFAEDSVVIREDDIGTDMYFTLEGYANVEMLSPDPSHRPHKLAEVKGGDFFGEMSFLTGSRRSAQVRAMSPLSVIIFSRDKLVDMFEKDPRIGYVFVKKIAISLAEKLQNTDLQWRNLI